MDAGVKHNKSVSFFYDCTNNKKLLRLQRDRATRLSERLQL